MTRLKVVRSGLCSLQTTGIQDARNSTCSGWGVAPNSDRGSCEAFKNHLKKTICRGDQNLFTFIWDWLADIFQHPTLKNGVILVLRGKQGTGRSFIGEVVLSKILGAAYTILNDPDTLTNRFNGALSNRLVVHLDEAFFSGDPAVRSKIKNLSTSPYIQIELKGHEMVKQNNYIRLFITTNADWAAPVEHGNCPVLRP